MTASRILTTHTGSLPRPKALVQLYAWRVDGKPVDEARLAAMGELATRDVVKRQAAAGIDIPSDGEQLRESFFLYVRRRMSGFGGQWERPGGRELDGYPDFAEARRRFMTETERVSNFRNPMATGPVEYASPEANATELRVFKDAMAQHAGAFSDAFMTAPSPGIVERAMKNAFYPTDEAYLDALADALSVEYRAAIDAGLMLQIDAPDLALERHLSFADQPVEAFVRFVETVVTRINRAIAGLPKDRIRLHVCWGNYESPHDKDVALEAILPAVLEAEVGAFVLPFANPRHAHEIKLFRGARLKPDQRLIAGVIDVQSSFVEHPEVIADRLEQAVEAVGDPSRVQAGTDCGFDTSAGMGRVTPDVVWAKLRTLREGASLASTRVF